MFELRGLFIYIWFNRESIDAGLILWKSLIAKKFDTENLTFFCMILEFYTQKIRLCFRISVLLNQNKMIILIYHVHGSFIHKKNKY